MRDEQHDMRHEKKTMQTLSHPYFQKTNLNTGKFGDKNVRKVNAVIVNVIYYNINMLFKCRDYI